MARMDLRVRLLGRALKPVSVATLDDDQLARAQARQVRHNPLTDLVIGGMARGVDVRRGEVAGAEGRLPVRVHRPRRQGDGPLPLVVDVHGGGWTLGSPEMSDWRCSSIAATVGAVVVSIGYRLAPAHRWPAAPDDCYAALVDLVGRAAELRIDPQRVAVVGDSAGGNLAAVMCLMARDRSGPSLAFQGLVYPATDLTLSSPSLERNAHAPILSRRDAYAFVGHYLGGQDPRDPYVSPLRSPDLTGLPRALVQVAEHDPIRDDGLRYAEALRAAGVPVRTTEYVGMPHGYLTFPRLCRSAPQALAELCAELTSALSPDPVQVRRQRRPAGGL